MALIVHDIMDTDTAMTMQKGAAGAIFLVVLLLLAVVGWYVWPRQAAVPGAQAPEEEVENEDTMDVTLYFANVVTDPEALRCDTAYPVVRAVPRTDAAARAALEALLSGPTAEEHAAGYRTAIRDGAAIRSLAVSDGTAVVDFALPADASFNDPQMGACGAQQAPLQVEETLTQFGTVSSVRATANSVPLEDAINP